LLGGVSKEYGGDTEAGFFDGFDEEGFILNPRESFLMLDFDFAMLMRFDQLLWLG
jgi:hypothetical protein